MELFSYKTIIFCGGKEIIMENIIREMIEKAIYYKDIIGSIDEAYDLIRFVRNLIDKFTDTINCPSNWKNIGEGLSEEYKDNVWVFDELKLWNYVEEQEV